MFPVIEVVKLFVCIECYKLSIGRLMLRNDTPKFSELGIRAHHLYYQRPRGRCILWRFAHPSHFSLNSISICRLKFHARVLPALFPLVHYAPLVARQFALRPKHVMTGKKLHFYTILWIIYLPQIFPIPLSRNDCLSVWQYHMHNKYFMCPWWSTCCCLPQNSRNSVWIRLVSANVCSPVSSVHVLVTAKG
jgi:hypothetical protein